MIKTVMIVSLSSGILGEPFVRHELDLGVRRLESLGLTVKFADNALRSLSYLREHPEARAADLLQAFRDPETDMILCAIGGDDTYRLLPHLFGENELRRAVADKLFLGFSDTTFNHFMLRKVGLRTFYGQAFLPDLCEPAPDMLPYTRSFFEELIHTGGIRAIRPSDVWYDERESFGPEQLGVPRKEHRNEGFTLLQGPDRFSGEILGGCLDSIHDMFNTDCYADTVELCRRYELFPSLEEWRGKILLLETSEEKPSPDSYRQMLTELRDYGLFRVTAGLITGKPMDETYAAEYRQILTETVDDPSYPILWNVSVGHATPRCIIPFGVRATVDAGRQEISFDPVPASYLTPDQ